MTEQEARGRIDCIKEVVDDEEKAHILEDVMLWTYLTDQAEHDPVAKIIMEYKGIPFSRWCA